MPPTLADGVVVALEHVSKTYPPPRRAHPFVRALSRLGGVELDEGIAPEGDLDEDEEEVERDELEVEEEDLRVTETTALRDVSLTVAAGSCVGLVGPPGSGKSVLLRLVAGLSAPTEGRILVRGTVAPALPAVDRVLASREGIRKSALAVAMMTRLPRRVVKERLPEIFELAGLRDSDLGLGMKLTPQQRQRVVLAIMLSVDADVLLIDVPLTTGRMRERFVERIRERLAGGTAVVIASPSVGEIVELVDDVVRLDAGQINSEERDADADGLEVDETGDVDDASAQVRSERQRELAEGLEYVRTAPLSPDARRYFEFARVLAGDRRAVKAVRLADESRPSGAQHVEWDELARCAGFDWTQHLAVVERLRQLYGDPADGPIVGADVRLSALPLSGDAERYLDFLRVLEGDDRAESARRNALAYAPDHAERVEWTWLARWAGHDWADELPVVQRLRRLHAASDTEPIYGARELRRKLGGR